MGIKKDLVKWGTCLPANDWQRETHCQENSCLKMAEYETGIIINGVSLYVTLCYGCKNELMEAILTK